MTYVWRMPAPPTPPAVEVSGVSRTFGRRRAVDAVDLSLGAGDCLALFGPNGAGKTTLLRVIAGLLKPTTGTVRVGGRSLRNDPGARGQLGLISHQSMLYRALTARENLAVAASFMRTWWWSGICVLIVIAATISRRCVFCEARPSVRRVCRRGCRLCRGS